MKGSAIGLALVTLSTGCQLVFGIDDYEADGPLAPDGGGSAGGADGGAGTGGTTVDGGGGTDPGPCACDLAAIWQPTRLAARGPGTEPIPETCSDASTPMTLYLGPPNVACTPCACEPTGCELPELVCFESGNCTGASVQGTPASGDCSTPFSNGCRSYSLAADVGPPDCSVSGGEVVDGELTFGEYLSFCGDSCEAGCANASTECVAAEGVVADSCPEGFSHRYVLAGGGDPSCEACSCSAVCTGPAYQAGGFGCEDYDVVDTTCTTPPFITFLSHSSLETTCSTNHGATYAGTFELGDHHTVCCRGVLAGVPQAPE